MWCAGPRLAGTSLQVPAHRSYTWWLSWQEKQLVNQVTLEAVGPGLAWTSHRSLPEERRLGRGETASIPR